MARLTAQKLCYWSPAMEPISHVQCNGPTDRLPGSAESLRLPRTVHCSVPRDTPPEPSNTPRLMYFPIPNTTCREPSRAWAITHTFSVHDRSEWATVPKVSIICGVSVLSAGTSGPCNAHRVNIDDIKCHSWK